MTPGDGEPDWPALKEIAREVSDLAHDVEGGRWLTRSEFDRIYPKAVAATRGHRQFLEFIENVSDPEWFRDL